MTPKTNGRTMTSLPRVRISNPASPVEAVHLLERIRKYWTRVCRRQTADLLTRICTDILNHRPDVIRLHPDLSTPLQATTAWKGTTIGLRTGRSPPTVFLR